VVGPGRKESAQIELKDLSGREIKNIAEKAAKKKMLTELKRTRVSPPSSHETGILMMSRLSIPVEKIATKLKVNRKTAKNHSENPKFIQSIKKSHKKGDPCNKIAEEFGCPEPLVWSITLEGKSDLERFKALGWGLRTWDQWFFNDLDRRFGDEWPGQIPAQLVGHTLHYFSKIGDLVFDAMAGDDLLIITADHGCDPTHKLHTDHTREYVPLLVYGTAVKNSVDLGTRETFADCGQTIADLLDASPLGHGQSFKKDIIDERL